MASNKKPTLEENKISASGWTMPQDVVGELPPPRPEIGADVLAMLDLAWDSTAHRWVGPRFALLLDGGWSTGQEGLFGEITPPEGSWPKQAAVLEPGEVLDVRPWVPRPMDTPVMPTPVSYDATPGGPGNHYKGLGHQAKHGGELFSTPTASTATGADMVQAKFPGNSPDRPDYEEATRIFAEGKPGLWRTPSARDYKGADPKNATGRQVGLNDQVKKEGNTFRGDGKLFATPQHHDGGAGKADRVGRFGTLAGGRNLNDEALAFPIKGALLPTPTGTERAGTNPSTGKGGGLSRHVKDEAGLFPTPRAGKVSGESEEAWRARQERGDVSTPPLELAVKIRPDRNYPTPVASDQHQRRKTENWAGTSDLPSVVTDLEEQGGAVVPRAGGQLNPDWVDLLMGYPLGTTRLDPAAEPWFAVDSRRLKASDLKKLHAMDAHDESDDIPEEGDDAKEAGKK